MRTILTLIWRTSVILALMAASLTACGTNTKVTPGPGAKIKVVAAESTWGSIAEQLGGDKVAETSIVANPDTDPHDYDPTPADSSTIAQSQLMVINGLGYDGWATKAVDANPASSRQVINVGALLGLKDGDNPHRWYSPTDVALVANAITSRLKAIDGTDSSTFDQLNRDFITQSLSSYNQLRSQITTQFKGVAVGATESIFSPLAQDLGLNLITPSKFLTAISEGDEPTAADKATFDKQITSKEIKALVFNSQNSTPDVQRLVDKANAEKIPVVSITETPSPANVTFQDWQSRQLSALLAALVLAADK